MNYMLNIKARLDGKSMAEAHKVIEILTSLNGCTLEEYAFKPLEQPTIVVDRAVERKQKRQLRTFSEDPRMVYGQEPHPGRPGFMVRVIDIPASLKKMALTERQILDGVWQKQTVEYRVAQALRRRNLKALKP